MTTRRILLLDCTTRKEPCEGRLLKEFFEICRLYKPCKAASLYYKIKSKKEFLSKLNTGKRYNIIHISAHGPPDCQEIGIGNGSTWLASPADIEHSNHKVTLVFVNACLANRRVMADSFKGAKYFLAPKTEVQWVDAAMFSLAFYKRYIVDGVSMRSAFKYARRMTQTSNDYPNYWER